MSTDDNAGDDLAAVICSRICHDLVSPVGAIVNGVDLIREIGPGGLDSEFSMISQSADRASGLLQFYRIAFGAAGSDAEDLSRTILKERAEDMIASPRVLLQWVGAEGKAVERAHARLLCQLLLCARAVTGMRGTVSVFLPEDDTFPMQVVIEGDGSADAQEHLAILTSEDDQAGLSPRVVEFALARGSASEIGATLSVDHQPGQMKIKATRP